jgi:7-cyano-7-deazaguanine synthase in queuosine biosynthesis
LTYSFTLKMDVIYSFETWAFYHYSPEDCTLLCENCVNTENFLKEAEKKPTRHEDWLGR